jgi:hypothetical protein
MSFPEPKTRSLLTSMKAAEQAEERAQVRPVRTGDPGQMGARQLAVTGPGHHRDLPGRRQYRGHFLARFLDLLAFSRWAAASLVAA